MEESPAGSSNDGVASTTVELGDDAQRVTATDPATADDQSRLPAEDSGPGESPFEVGAIIGRYEITGLLGKGGMGTVYRARDLDLARDVAIKVLRPDRMGGGPTVAQSRLQREARAMAKLSHPNVVTVHEVRLFDGQLFVVMELVTGCTLTDWLADGQRSVDEKLDIFVQAGEGLAAAHRADLVHRDFKPDNILLDDSGRVRIADFGLVRTGERPAVECTREPPSSASLPPHSLTRTGAVLGTPRYMAPEQHQGRPADARSDQFSFCVALYEALYGCPPFPGASYSDLSDNVIGGRLTPPPRKGSVPERVRRALLRGLSTDPADRFNTMEALLDVLAKRRAHRRWLPLIGVGLPLALVGLYLGLSPARDSGPAICSGAERKLAGIWDASTRAAIGDAVIASAPTGRDSWRRIAHALDAYAEEWRAEYAAACRTTDAAGRQPEIDLDLRMVCLDRRLGELRAFTAALGELAPTDLSAAVKGAHDLTDVGRCSDVESLRKTAGFADAASRQRADEVQQLLAQAGAQRLTGHYQAGIELADRAVTLAREIGHQPTEAEALFRLGELEQVAGNSMRAKEHLFGAFVAAQACDHRQVAASAAVGYSFVVGYQLAQPAEGVKWAERARAAVAEVPGDELLRARLAQNLAVVYWMNSQLEESEAEARRAIEIYQRVAGPSSPKLVAPLGNLAVIIVLKGALDEAAALHQRAIAIVEQSLGPDHPDLVFGLGNLGDVRFLQARYEEARDYSARALALGKAALGTSHHQTIRTMANLGKAYYMLGDLDRARRELVASLQLREEHLGREHPDVATSLSLVATIDIDEGKLDEAEEKLLRAMAIAEANEGPNGYSVVPPLLDIARIHRLRNQHQQALAAYRKSLAIWEAAVGPDNLVLPAPLLGIGTTLLEMKEPRAAIAPLERALRIRNAQPKDPAELGEIRFALGRALWQANVDRGRAVELVGAARAPLRAAGKRGKESLAAVSKWLDRH